MRSTLSAQGSSITALVGTVLVGVALILAASFTAASFTPLAAAAATGDIEVVDAIASPGERVAAMYFTVTAGDSADALTGVRTDVADATMHRTVVSDGLTRMRRTDRMPIPAGDELTLVPGGSHVMLEDLVRPLTVGDRFDVQLDFESSESLRVSVTVVSDQEIAALQVDPPTAAAPGESGGSNQRRLQLVAAIVALGFIFGAGALASRHIANREKARS